MGHQTSVGQLVRAVQKFPPVELLTALAKVGCEQTARHKDDPSKLLDGRSSVTPWAVVELARESIVHGLQGGQRPPSPADVERLCGLYANLEDPISDHTLPVERFLVRLGFEQFQWQMSQFEELARVHALFVDGASRVHAPTFSASAWVAALGCPVADFVEIGFFLFTWASLHEGWIDLGWMDLPHFAPVRRRYPRAVVEAVVTRRLAATFGELRTMDPPIERGRMGVAEHRFNPLTARPLARMRDGRLLAPHPLLILHRIGVNGLYYDRCAERGFTEDLGRVFEAYVGMHLDLLQGAHVRPEVRLGKSDRSVDWIVVLPEVVMLVEVKATRLTEPSRVGLDQLDHDRARTIGKARSQIERTARLIRDGHPALDFVPRDRPIRGLVVTLEPYWNAVSGFGPAPTGDVPTTVASIREVEYLGGVGTEHSVGSAIASLSGTHSNQALVRALEDFPRVRNPILERGWEASLRWAS